MKVNLPDLPYAMDALEPHISKETLSFHYGKHHAGYVKKVQAAIEGTDKENMALDAIIQSASGGLFNNAAQVWNHTLYWRSMSPNGGGEPTGKLAEAITRDFGSFGEFKSKFSDAAGGQFGSGWAWLVKKSDGKLEIQTTSNAETPLTQKGATALLTCDVWEHAYYIDYRNARPDYISAWWKLVNWDYANEQLGK